MSEDQNLDRHAEKMAKKKAARDKMMAKKIDEKGLVIVNTGKGKGKSSAAFGMALRCVGHGFRVGVIQFIKGAWDTAERRVFEGFPDLVTFKAMGEGFTWETQDKERDIAAAAKAWAAWEGNCATLRLNPGAKNQMGDARTALSMARMEVHYFLNHGFIEENQILNNMESIKDIPGVIVHGRYDMICPVEQAFELHAHWLGSELNIIRDAGHASLEPGTVNALIKATDEMAKKQSSRA